MTDLSQAFLSYCRARPDDPAAHLFGTESAVLSRRDLINGAARAASVTEVMCTMLLRFVPPPGRTKRRRAMARIIA